MQSFASKLQVRGCCTGPPPPSLALAPACTSASSKARVSQRKLNPLLLTQCRLPDMVWAAAADAMWAPGGQLASGGAYGPPVAVVLVVPFPAAGEALLCASLPARYLRRASFIQSCLLPGRRDRRAEQQHRWQERPCLA